MLYNTMKYNVRIHSVLCVRVCIVSRYVVLGSLLMSYIVLFVGGRIHYMTMFVLIL